MLVEIYPFQRSLLLTHASNFWTFTLYEYQPPPCPPPCRVLFVLRCVDAVAGAVVVLWAGARESAGGGLDISVVGWLAVVYLVCDGRACGAVSRVGGFGGGGRLRWWVLSAHVLFCQHRVDGMGGRGG